MRIGELAELVGVSTRTIRHYHRVGLLPEPERRANGYRTYVMRDVLRLARARRLVELGLSLDEVGDVLADDEGRDLDEILAELDADLARQQNVIADRRARLAEIMSSGRGSAGSRRQPVSREAAQLIARLSTLAPGSAAGEKDRDYLALMDAHDDAPNVVQRFTSMVTVPGGAEKVAALYLRFDGLAEAPVDDPRIEQLAADIVADVAGGLLPPDLTLPEGDLEEHPFGTALLGDLSPAQAEVLRATYALVSRGGGGR